ncbi:dGTP triphosphohydrolase [Oceanobacillus sp. Castelsardo]|uniref:dGTP triphosphohydrolase n=1 Tax=Oceanobacillus sp. Castelsardo TaxID=1851204 RepID=UPI0012E832A7|nr:dNTP triphosphohydrolase [Oceanobacillus sp. Castelsardo]
MIRWEKILNETRPKYRDKKTKEMNNTGTKDIYSIVDHRNEFERDYDRIMSSSSLRRLQDKAQVFPLQSNDFIRTRLTHSMEVSAIARSFGVWIEKYLTKSKRGNLAGNDNGKIPAMLATAGLVHDIGNPPFGHYGEDVIKKWFHEFFEANPSINLTTEEKNDFRHFDGNAQGLRVLTRLQFLNDQYGINFTYGTLSILLKYPWDSSSNIKKDKFGYFQQDKELAEEIMQQTVGIPFVRNPLTYFLEASDDIAYLGSDIEDGVKKGIIPWEEVFEKDILMGDIYKLYKREIEQHKLIQKHKKAKDNQFPDYLLTSVQNFKVWAQGQMIREVKEVFIKNYKEIMNGTYDKGDLLESTDRAYQLNNLLRELMGKHIYPNNEVLSLELVGDSVITELLNAFVKDCILHDGEFKPREKPGKLLNIISGNFRFVHQLNDDVNNPRRVKEIEELDDYSRLLLVTDYISGMTDSFALDLHQKLKGVKMP